MLMDMAELLAGKCGAGGQNKLPAQLHRAGSLVGQVTATFRGQHGCAFGQRVRIADPTWVSVEVVHPASPCAPDLSVHRAALGSRTDPRPVRCRLASVAWPTQSPPLPSSRWERRVVGTPEPV